MTNDAQWGALMLGYAALVGVPATIYVIFLNWRAGTLNKLESPPRVSRVENRVVLLGLGLVLLIAARELDLGPLVGAVLAVVYVIGVLTFSVWRRHLRSDLRSPSDPKVESCGQTIGLRLMFASLAVLVVLIGAGNAIAEWLPYDPDHYGAYDFFEAKWPHVIVALAGLWGAYLYVKARSKS